MKYSLIGPDGLVWEQVEVFATPSQTVEEVLESLNDDALPVVEGHASEELPGMPTSPIATSLAGLTINVPEKTLAMVGEASERVDASGELNLSFDYPGKYRLTLVPPFPYLRWEGVLEVAGS